MSSGEKSQSGWRDRWRNRRRDRKRRAAERARHDEGADPRVGNVRRGGFKGPEDYGMGPTGRPL
jgi:hypothetical protein